MSLHRHCLKLASRCLLQNFTKTNILETRNIKRWVAPTLRELQRRQDKVGPLPEQPRSSYLEWNYDAEIYSFGKRLGEDFDAKLLKQALTNRTYANLAVIKSEKEGKSEPKPDDNWEMIEEGGRIISAYIRKRYSEKYPDDVVNALHGHLTGTEMLAHVGSHMGLKDIILTSEFPVENQTIADTLKAVVYALKQSQNLERCHLFIEDFLISQIHDKDIDEVWNLEEPYEYLQKLSKAKGIVDLAPRLCNKSAMNTILANYQVGIYSSKKLLGIGWGESIETAKKTAALDAIYKIYKLNSISSL